MFTEFSTRTEPAARGRLAISAGASLALYGALAAAVVLSATAAAPEVRRQVEVVFRPPPPPVELAPTPPPKPAFRPPPPKTLKTVEVANLPAPAPLVEPVEIPAERPAEAEPTGGAIPVPAPPAGGAAYGTSLTSLPAPGEPIHLPEHAQPPVALSSNSGPEYPEAARARGAEGQVLLRIVVDADGAVSRVEILRGEEPFAGAAAAAVRRWRYRPALLDGTPVAAYRIVKVPFRLRDG